MNLTKETAMALARLVGQPYASFNCWPLVRFCYATQDVELHEDPQTSVSTQFRRLADDEEAQPWDVIGIRNHPVLVTHAALYLGDNLFLHAMKDTDTLISNRTRAPWNHKGRIAAYYRLLT